MYILYLLQVDTEGKDCLGIGRGGWVWGSCVSSCGRYYRLSQHPFSMASTLAFFCFKGYKAWNLIFIFEWDISGHLLAAFLGKFCFLNARGDCQLPPSSVLSLCLEYKLDMQSCTRRLTTMMAKANVTYFIHGVERTGCLMMSFTQDYILLNSLSRENKLFASATISWISATYC